MGNSVRTTVRDAEERAMQMQLADYPERHYPEANAEREIPQDFIEYIFTLQGKIEKSGGMDYHRYARELWARYVSEDAVTLESEQFKIFDADIVAALARIEMSELVYGDIEKNMPTLIRELERTVDKVMLWSTGDVDATGYQVLKIKRSGIVSDTYAAVKKTLGHQYGKDLFRERTEYMVSTDKFAKLREYLLGKRESGATSVKIGVIEDSLGNIEKVKQLVREIFGDNGEVVPVWAAYSREGKQIMKRMKAEGKERGFVQLCRENNAIARFSDVLQPQHLSMLSGAELLVDFDGVIGDNMKMRDAQAQAIYGVVARHGWVDKGSRG